MNKKIRFVIWDNKKTIANKINRTVIGGQLLPAMVLGGYEFYL